MELENGYKQTEIGVIPSDWHVLNLGKSSTLKARIGWQGLTTAEYLKSGDYFLITGTDFKDGYIDWDNCVYVEKERYVQDKNIQVKIDDILVTKDGTIGKVAFVDKVPKETTLNSGVFVVRPISKIYNSRYLYYILMSEYFKDFLNRLTAGSTISHLYQKDFIFFDFPKPSLKEQTAIATALSDIDNWINSLEQLLGKKRQIKQGAMQELLQPKKGWKVKNLGDIVDFKNGAAHENVVDKNGRYIIVNSKFISQNGNVVKHSNLNLCPLYKGEIAMVMSDIPNGKALAKCFIVEKNTLYTLNQRICAFKAKEDFDEKFIFYKINRNDYYLSFDSGSGQTNLRKDEVLNCPITFPNTKSEQTRIATILSDIDTEIEQLETKLNKSKQVKQGMMQNLLTGRIRLVKNEGKNL
ncbi:restriction endonuclease subunit S [Flavobacterium sp. CAN_S2]|uniref:restriction endonuclease subunit S n=1 Tax=Flavobacterium sp. CAN_S2 TaxID=2787726 RepID=UPI0018CB7863